MSVENFLIREFIHDGTASSGFTLNITGSYTTLEMKMGKAWDGTMSGGTTWIDMTQAYNASNWNNGNPTSGGSLTGGSHHTFGTNNMAYTNNTFYLRVGFTAGQRITALSVIFD